MRNVVSSLRSSLLTRVAVVALISGATAACSSDSSRFGEEPFSNPFSTSAAPPKEPSYTGAIRPAPADRVVRGPLGAPPPAQARPMRGFEGEGSYRPSSVEPRTTGSLPSSRAPVAVARGSSNWSAQGGSVVTMQDGDTINSLSQRYGVPASAIMQANGLQSANSVGPGQQIVIPVYSRSVAAAPDRSFAPSAPPAPSVRVAQAPAPVAPPAIAPAPRMTAVAPAAPRVAVTAPAMPRVAVAAPVAPRVAVAAPAMPRVAVAAPATPQLAPPAARVAMTPAAPKPVLTPPAAKVAVAAPAPTLKPVTAPVADAAKPKPLSLPQQKPVEEAAKPATKTAAALKPAVAAPQAPQAPAKTAERNEEVKTASLKTETPAEAEKPAGPSFRWPVRGRIISGYGSKSSGSTNDGINVAVPEGTEVKASDDGVVAYSGSELKGFGNLVLIRHSNGWVTAYAHNSALNVKRGDAVRRGQIIAKSGSTGNVSSPQLHFEVRKGAASVNPLTHLPDV